MPTVEAPIAAVTVYPQQARITRRGKVPLAGGPRLTFAGLPLTLDAGSVRVTGTGPALITGVDVRTERHAEPADAALRVLVEQRRTDQTTLDGVIDDEAAEVMKVDLLTSLAKRSGGSFAKALAAGTAEPARVAEVTDALSERLASALKARRVLGERITRLREDLAALDRRIAEHSARSEQDSTSVVVELEIAEPSGEAELELSYVVPSASWEPGYDIRVRGTDVTVTSYGLVTQHTGEDWPECELALSTARPAVSVVVPELQPWYLDRARPPAPAPPAAFGGAAPGGAPEMSRMRYAAAAASVPMAPKFAEAEQGTTAVTYRPSRPVAVPSGARGHRTTLAQLDLTAELGYVTAPVLAEEAYLRAKVVNTSENALRPGRASVFHDAEFVGTTRLEPWAPGEDLELALGVDDRIRVERELVRRTASKATLSGQKRREAEYRVTIGNHGPREAVVTVLDQAPVSRDDTITVRDVKTSPEPAETSALGEFTWRLTLAPGETGVVTLAYRVDVAKGVELSGWRE
ncbi:mucoidy inhibitor MuiA family protein [Amycolatopsis sp. OK19-0408]|uniref:Mucoidy inhibitor MuiA family protein n=1 Tax=Amycolatopsis iheyensis TaxID=2945988 RepID=A0A9X2SPQ4_9PSEU|nr:mucoidy inhibitor MuiA family protein [Amycolatopsis iheyensis]MCR6490417.1 mucoidy inhibitor MuiA family protein [Amycolatopsis iheyensis]